MPCHPDPFERLTVRLEAPRDEAGAVAVRRLLTGTRSSAERLLTYRPIGRLAPGEAARAGDRPAHGASTAVDEQWDGSAVP